MKKIADLRRKQAELLKRAENFKEVRTVAGAFISPADEFSYDVIVDAANQLGLRIAELEKPPLGVKPYYITAWSRIGELAEAIYRQYEAAKGDPELVSRWAEEIGWQCAMIQSLEEAENDG